VGFVQTQRDIGIRHKPGGQNAAKAEPADGKPGKIPALDDPLQNGAAILFSSGEDFVLPAASARLQK
jgi:hypothetical protein